MIDQQGWIFRPTDGGAPPPNPSAPPAGLPAAFLSRAVLVVEDEAMIAWMLEDLLADMGFTEITIAATGEDAVALAAQLDPGLIVSDINLGPRGIDGVAAAAAIVAQRRAPVVFVTAYAGADMLSRIHRDVPGARILRKPVAPHELESAIRTIATGNAPH